MLEPKITVCWLSQWLAPESRPSQLQTCQQRLGMLPMGTEHPSQATGTVPAEWGTACSWRPAEPAHTYPIVSGTNGETVSALRGSKLPSALLSRWCLREPFQELFRTRTALEGHQGLPTGLLSALAGVGVAGMRNTIQVMSYSVKPRRGFGVTVYFVFSG